jgi:CubicO group peptidase (beta-lactamase class C family)
LAPSARAQSQALRNAAAYSASRRGVSLYVAQRGELVFQDYPNEGGADRGWELASGTKSFTGVMAAAAIQDRLISSWDERASETLREWRGDERRRITIRDLLSLTSGIGGEPTLRPPSYADAVALPVAAAPGARFQYAPGPFQIFGEIIRRRTGADPVAYLQRRVLDPLGIRPTAWRRGRDGNPLMPQGAAFTARDWARFGWFVLRGGEGLVDANALDQCFQASRANPGYGLSWWLLRDGLIPPGRMSGIELDAAMSEQFGVIRMAAGAGDQRLYLVPELDLVIARQASQILRSFRARGDERWSDAAFLRTILAE